MTNREIKLELAKAALGSESHNIETVKHFYKWVMEEDIKETNTLESGYDDKPIGEVISQIYKEDYYYHKFAVRLEKVFASNDIKTVGDLLRYGRTNFSRLQNVGRGCLTHIDDALEELYGLKSWY